MADMDALLFFDGRPAEREIYEAFERRVLDEIDSVRIRVQKTQISFSNGKNFACVSRLRVRRARELPEAYIVVSFGLGWRVDSPRIAAATEPYPDRWTHHVVVARPEEVDDELMAWVRAAGVFSASKRPRR